MGVAFVNQDSSTAAATTMVLDVPASTANGHVMVMVVYAALSSTTITVQGGGWTTLRNHVNASDGSKMWTFWRIASSEPASYTVNASPAEDMAGIILTYSGNHATAPINGSNSSTTNANQAQTSSSVTPSVNDCMILALFGSNSNASHLPCTPDSSPVANERAEVYEVGEHLNLYAEDYLQASAASISLDMSWASALAVSCCNVIIAIEPAAGPTPPYVSISVG